MAAQHIAGILDRAARVAHYLAPDARGRSSSEVGPQGLATAPAQVVRMVLREEQYASTKPVLGENPEPTLVEVAVKRLPGA